MNSKSPLIKVTLPLSLEERSKLKAGQALLLTGELYVLRDAGHMRLLEELKSMRELPYNLEGETIFYAGPTPGYDEVVFGAIGPTTASRMDFAAPALYDAGLVATIGKGYRNQAVREACVRNNALYFVATGGAAAYLAQCIERSELIAYKDLGTEALRKISVKDFPVFVGIDTQGNDIYELSTSEERPL